VRDMWRNIEQTSPSGWWFELRDGGRLSPMEIQRYYLAKLETIVESDGERRALGLLERVLELLEGRSSREAARMVEWLDRYFAIQDYVDRDGRSDPEAAMKACKRYSELSEGRSLYHERVRRGLVDRVVSDARILEAVTNPPRDTRASLRTKIARSMEVERMDWSRVTVRGEGGARELFLDDPFECDMEGL